MEIIKNLYINIWSGVKISIKEYLMKTKRRYLLLNYVFYIRISGFFFTNILFKQVITIVCVSLFKENRIIKKKKTQINYNSFI